MGDGEGDLVQRRLTGEWVCVGHKRLFVKYLTAFLENALVATLVPIYYNYFSFRVEGLIRSKT